MTPNDIDSKATYTGKQVRKMLEKATHGIKSHQAEEEGKGNERWKEVRSKTTVRREKLTEGLAPFNQKRKHSPEKMFSSPEGC